jgi:hypothetical protein
VLSGGKAECLEDDDDDNEEGVKVHVKKSYNNHTVPVHSKDLRVSKEIK